MQGLTLAVITVSEKYTEMIDSGYIADRWTQAGATREKVYTYIAKTELFFIHIPE